MKSIMDKIFGFFLPGKSSAPAENSVSTASDENQKENPFENNFSKDSSEANADVDDAITDDDEEEIDWENRILCSDGNCIGVIGPDGRCNVCGKPFEGNSLEICEEENFPEDSQDDFAEELLTDENEPSFSDENSSQPDIVEEMEEPEDTTDLDLEWQQRRLCSDGNCIGVIGPDGRCKVCGKPWNAREDD
jgi:hypothetical protein